MTYLFPDLLDVTRSMLRAETSRIHDSTMHAGGGGGGGGAGAAAGPVSVRSPLDHVEIAYAEQVVRYNALAVSVSAGGTPKPDLLGKFRQVQKWLHHLDSWQSNSAESQSPSSVLAHMSLP